MTAAEGLLSWRNGLEGMEKKQQWEKESEEGWGVTGGIVEKRRRWEWSKKGRDGYWKWRVQTTVEDWEIRYWFTDQPGPLAGGCSSTWLCNQSCSCLLGKADDPTYGPIQFQPAKILVKSTINPKCWIGRNCDHAERVHYGTQKEKETGNWNKRKH